jgi:AMP-polyphosphate phosphotransferase
MSKRTPSLSALLKNRSSSIVVGKPVSKKSLKDLQLHMLRIQQGMWHLKKRAIVVFEGFDAAGKGGTIRELIESLDPRGVRVNSIAEPAPDDQAKHYLYRFWQCLPLPGSMAIFDRSWYGRVLVERVEKLTPKNRWRAAYREILQFESLLQDDGVEMIKIFLAIDKKEQLRRFEKRLHDPYKQWKLTKADVEARSRWDEYVEAVDQMFEKTHTKKLPWHLVPANDKKRAHAEVLRIVTKHLQESGNWMESKAEARHVRSLEAALRDLGVEKIL